MLISEGSIFFQITVQTPAQRDRKYSRGIQILLDCRKDDSYKLRQNIVKGRSRVTKFLVPKKPTSIASTYETAFWTVEIHVQSTKSLHLLNVQQKICKNLLKFQDPIQNCLSARPAILEAVYISTSVYRGFAVHWVLGSC